MKKFLLCFILPLAIIFNIVGLSGCFYDGDTDIAEGNFINLLECLQGGNKTEVTNLFADNIVSGIENFDDSVTELLDYYDGEYVSFKRGGTGTSYDSHYGQVIKYFNISYDVTTTEDVYRFHMIWRVEDTADEGNIGIWSLSIIRYADDPLKDGSYGGDGFWTNGINIGAINVMYYVKLLLEYIQSEDLYSIKNLFAQSCLSSVTALESEIQDLIGYYSGEYTGIKYQTPVINSQTTEEAAVIYYDVSFSVTTDSDIYYSALRWCVKDTGLQADVGLWSLYIINSQEYTSDEEYWGNGLWTSGINIGKTRADV